MQETEVKFYIRDLIRIKSRLDMVGAHPVQERTLEINQRFDLPGEVLRAEGRVLRLRQDTATRLTYKGGSEKRDGILSREEIEFVIEDFEKAQRLFEALGYQKLAYYEKYRAIYDLNETHIMLDELPYGNFVEIEGESDEAIRRMAAYLQLSWGTAVGTSYLALFERVRKALNLPFEELSFTNFAKINVDASQLGVDAADE